MQDNDAPLLSVEGLAVEFRNGRRQTLAVDDVSFDVRPGETLIILGESGSGKSVSASAIMDLLETPPAKIQAGRIMFADRDLLVQSRGDRKRVNGRRIAIVFQDPLAYLNPLFTVGRQIEEMFSVHRVAPPEGARQATIALMEQVGIPQAASRIDDYPHQFSGGQRQRLMIAMAIALRPDVVICDEPTTALDVTMQRQILDLLKSLQKQYGMAIVLITHDRAVAAYMADRVVVMKRGRVVESGPAAEVLSRPAHSYTRSLLSAAPKARDKAESGDSPVVLEVSKLTKHYQVTPGVLGPPRSVAALEDVSFSLRRGEVLAVVGESGSGKSTLVRVLLRMNNRTGGTASFHGRDIYAMSRSELTDFRRKVSIVFQDPFGSLNPKMRVRDLVAEPLCIAQRRSAAQFRDEVIGLLEQVGLDASYADRYPHQLSGGQCQRVAIARAIIGGPEVIIFDEAVSALDALVQVQVIDMLSELRRARNLSYLFITHDLHLVRDFSDKLMVMQQGRVVEAGATEDIFADPRHDYTRRLFTALPRPALDPQAMGAADG